MRTLCLISLLLLTSCHEWKHGLHEYSLGQKVLMKTGDTAVIVNVYSTRYRGDTQPVPRYIVRVTFTKRVDQDWWNGRTETDIGTFTVYEYEIEKALE